MLVIAIQFLLLPHFHILPLPVLHICARKSSSDFSVELDLLPPFYILRSVWTRVNPICSFWKFPCLFYIIYFKNDSFYSVFPQDKIWKIIHLLMLILRFGLPGNKVSLFKRMNYYFSFFLSFPDPFFLLYNSFKFHLSGNKPILFMPVQGCSLIQTVIHSTHIRTVKCTLGSY